MSRRRVNTEIRGPQSALTDYLAQHGISARQIRDTYDARLVAAQEAAAAEAAANPDADVDALAAETMAREEAQAKAIEDATDRALASSRKKSKKSKKRPAGETDDELDAELISRKVQKLPGQLANCGDCEVRFTVTPYSKPNADGDLLCPKCSKALTSKEPVKKKAANRDKRRTQQSNILDGKKQRGAKSLTEMCVEKVASSIDDVSEFGDIHPKLLDGISMILSKRRKINPTNHKLFVETAETRFAIYDCAKLQVEDYKLIATKQPQLQELVLRRCGQIKDEVIDHWIDNFESLRAVRLEGPNLVTDDAWQRFFSRFGANLTEFHLSWMDNSFNEETVAMMVDCCPNLRSLKLKKVWKLDKAGFEKISEFKNLEVLALMDRSNTVLAEDLVELIKNIGNKLTTLSLLEFAEADDTVLEAIHTHCHNLRILKLTKNDVFSSKGFTDLFTDWDCTKLDKLNLRDCCNMSHQDPLVNNDGYGFDGPGFVAAMQHSGIHLSSLDVNSDRHITYDALAEVFPVGKHYAKLRLINLSFVGDVDDIILKRIEQCCPMLERIWVFGCWKLTAAVNLRPSIVVTGCLARDVARENELGAIGGRIQVPDANDEDIAMLLSQAA